MHDINFKPEFASAIRSGDKTQTIRKERKKNPILVGDSLVLYTGMRTKSCLKLAVVRCVSVSKVTITNDAILLDNKEVANETEFAKADGFSNIDDFKHFFSEFYGLPFEGVLIKWRKNRSSNDQGQ